MYRSVVFALLDNFVTIFATPKFLSINVRFADVDECLIGAHGCTCSGLTGCTASCINNVSSYTCGCSAGFTLDVDGETCIGKCWNMYR